MEATIAKLGPTYVGVRINLKEATSLKSALRISPNFWDEWVQSVRDGIDKSDAQEKIELLIINPDGSQEIHKLEYLKEHCCYEAEAA